MTVPPAAAGFTLADAVASLGEPLFESRVLLFGRVPVETSSSRSVRRAIAGAHARSPDRRR